MKAAADTEHYYASKPGTSNSLESLRSYLALNRFAKSVKDQAYAQAALFESAGVLLEQARSKKGCFEDVRSLCQSIESDSSPSQRCFFYCQAYGLGIALF